MIKKIVHIFIWIILIAWFTVTMGFISRTNANLLCKELIISISDSASVKFITSEMVRETIHNSGINTQGYPIEGIVTRDLEKLLEKDPYVANAEVFVNVDGDLSVVIEQRQPLLRLMPGGKSGYFIDHEGVILPLSDNFSPMELLVTGKIPIDEIQDANGMRRVELENNIELQKLMNFANYVKSNEFWSKQIVQLHRAREEDYEIYPRVGAHQILIGSMDEYEDKLRNLELLYDQGLTKYGWNKYNKINLKYSNQIICTKR
jgi:cell division protein FtsQ